MNNNSKWEKFRIPGVLQRIGVSYFIVSISHLGNFKILTEPNLKYLHVSLAPFCIFEHYNGVNLHVEIKSSDPLF